MIRWFIALARKRGVLENDPTPMEPPLAKELKIELVISDKKQLDMKVKTV